MSASGSMRVAAERSRAGATRACRHPRGLARLDLAKRTKTPGRPAGTSTRSARYATVRAQAVVESLSSVDPNHLHDHMAQVLYSLADADVVAAAADSASSAAADVVAAVPPEKKAGFFQFFATVLEAFLKGIDGVLEFAHVPYSYGFSIILLTILVKVGTFPLSKKQLESNMQIQALQPRIAKLKEQYADDQEQLQLETAKLYKVAEVNPLAGCLPAFVSLPIYIGLYRSLTQAAEEGLLTEGFFWIPSLAGPTTIAARQAGTGSAWLFPFENGAPPIGWHDASLYLVLPALLIASQYASQKILAGQQQQSQENQSANAIIKFLPLMIGWFSLNVPAGLTLYWFTNNLLSVGQTAFLRANFKAPEISEGSTSGGLEVERVSAAKQLQSKAPPPPPKRTGDKFWALKNQESGGSVVAEVLSKPQGSDTPKAGSKFWDLKAKEIDEVTSNTSGTGGAAAEVAQAVRTTTTTTEVAEPQVQVAKVAEVAKEEEKEEEEEPAPARRQSARAKKTSALRKKGKGKGNFQKRKK